MSLDRTEHATRLIHKIKFDCVYGKIFFLIEPSSELPKSTCHLLRVPLTLESVWNLDPSLFFSTSVVSLVMFCVRLLSEVMILLSDHHEIKKFFKLFSSRQFISVSCRFIFSHLQAHYFCKFFLIHFMNYE